MDVDWDGDSDLTELSSSSEDETFVPATRKGRKPSKQEYKPHNALKKYRPQTLSVQTLYDCIVDNTIDLDPEYQREVVWPESKQVGLIDSLLRNYYIPPIIFAVTNADDGGTMRTCIDGKQRLTSIQRFMDGLICHKDPTTGKRYYYKQVGSTKRQVLPRAYAQQFAASQVMCIEYDTLSPDQEREIFQRVQLGVALTPAERMQAITGPWPSFIRDIQKKVLGMDGFGDNIDWGHARGRDFQCLAQIVHLIHTYPAGKLATSPTLEKWLQNSSPVPQKLKDELQETFKIYTKLARDPRYKSCFNDKKHRLSPIEFVMSGVLIYSHRIKLSFMQLSSAIEQMRLSVRGVHADVRANTKVTRSLWDFIVKKVHIAQLKREPGDRPAYVAIKSDNVVATQEEAKTKKRKRQILSDSESDSEDEEEYQPRPTARTMTLAAKSQSRASATGASSSKTTIPATKTRTRTTTRSNAVGASTSTPSISAMTPRQMAKGTGTSSTASVKTPAKSGKQVAIKTPSRTKPPSRPPASLPRPHSATPNTPLSATASQRNTPSQTPRPSPTVSVSQSNSAGSTATMIGGTSASPKPSIPGPISLPRRHAPLAASQGRMSPMLPPPIKTEPESENLLRNLPVDGVGITKVPVSSGGSGDKVPPVGTARRQSLASSDAGGTTSQTNSPTLPESQVNIRPTPTLPRIQTQIGYFSGPGSAPARTLSTQGIPLPISPMTDQTPRTADPRLAARRSPLTNNPSSRVSTPTQPNGPSTTSVPVADSSMAPPPPPLPVSSSMSCPNVQASQQSGTSTVVKSQVSTTDSNNSTTTTTPLPLGKSSTVPTLPSRPPLPPPINARTTLAAPMSPTRVKDDADSSRWRDRNRDPRDWNRDRDRSRDGDWDRNRGPRSPHFERDRGRGRDYGGGGGGGSGYTSRDRGRYRPYP
ncbi:hypothetical protein C8Q75DRAFT_805632 [Abortiporus biennis]|nr:hypothetical protein C8Q75DRAFT_805632 [Abortiporus biennis]